MAAFADAAVSKGRAVLFSKTTDPGCAKAKRALDAAGLAGKYLVVELDKAQPDGGDAVCAVIGGVPRMFVDKEEIGGDGGIWADPAKLTGVLRAKGVLSADGLPPNYPTSVDQLPGRRRNHPLYRTSQQEFGKDAKEAAAQHRDKWAGRKGEFTKEFLGGPPRDCGLNIAMDKSRCVRDPGSLGASPDPLV